MCTICEIYEKLNVPGTPSPRKKRNNSTPTKNKTNTNDKKQLLQQLVSPAANASSKVLLIYK